MSKNRTSTVVGNKKKGGGRRRGRKGARTAGDHAIQRAGPASLGGGGGGRERDPFLHPLSEQERLFSHGIQGPHTATTPPPPIPPLCYGSAATRPSFGPCGPNFWAILFLSWASPPRCNAPTLSASQCPPHEKKERRTTHPNGMEEEEEEEDEGGACVLVFVLPHPTPPPHPLLPFPLPWRKKTQNFLGFTCFQSIAQPHSFPSLP